MFDLMKQYYDELDGRSTDVYSGIDQKPAELSYKNVDLETKINAMESFYEGLSSRFEVVENSLRE